MTARISRRVQKMHGYVPGEQPTGDDVIKLNTNENPYPPSPEVGRALREFNPDRLRRYCDPMCVELRSAIAGLHKRTVDEVFVGNGSDEILALCTRAFMENGESVGYLDPSYSLYPVLAEIRGCDTIEIPLGADFGWPAATVFDEQPWDSCGLFFVTNPNAPAGTLYPAETIGEFARGFSGLVVVDEAYVDFASADCLCLLDQLDNVMVSRSLSKSHALAGLRCGYALGPPDLIAALHKVKDAYNVDAITQVLALAAIGDQGYFRGNIDRVVATRARLAAALCGCGFDVHPSESNFLWVRSSTVKAPDLFAALKERDIYIRHFDNPRTRDFLRISIGTDDEVDALLSAIDQILADRR
jgi:histidinol-phosphate aminotransferase